MPKDTPKKVEELKINWTTYRARALERGFANNVLYQEGQEFEITIDAGITKPRWVELLDDGRPASDPSLLNSHDFATAKVEGPTTGFAAGHMPLPGRVG